MPKQPPRKKARNFLKCPYCFNIFALGRSYGNHVVRCPAQYLKTRQGGSLVHPAVLPTSSQSVAPYASASANNNNDSLLSAKGETYDTNNTSSDDANFNCTEYSSESESKSSLSNVGDYAVHHSSDNDSPSDDDNTPPNIDLTHLAAIPITKSLFPSFHCHTHNDAVHLKLMNICQQIRAPMYAYDMLLSWAQDANVSGYNFPMNAPSRKTFLDSLYNRFNMRGAKPRETSVTLFPNKVANVITFSFEEMVHSLINDRNLMQRKNLLILNNDTNVTEDLRSDINSGTWYKAASIFLCVEVKDVL